VLSLQVRCIFIFETGTIQLQNQSLLMSKVLFRFSLYSFYLSFHLLLIVIKHIQDFLCLIVHLMNLNTSVQILITRVPMIAIEITNICPKLKKLYMLYRVRYIQVEDLVKKSKNILSISSPLLMLLNYVSYCNCEIKLVQKCHINPHLTKKNKNPF